MHKGRVIMEARKKALETIQKSEKRAGHVWEADELHEIVNSVSTFDNWPELAKLQDRYWALVAKYEANKKND